MGVLALAMVAAFVTLPAPPPTMAASCTGWRSTIHPPPSIRVYRTAKGVVETVNFYAYVQYVMAAEYYSTWPIETLKAGAVAVKQYGWYYTMHYRGGYAGGRCYDVVDTWRDQVYSPATKAPLASHRAAVAASWPYSLRKSGSFLTTFYAAGSKVSCGSNSNGYRLYQWSAYDCGRRGATLEWILRRYYYPGLQVVRAGAHQITGTYRGDGSAAVPGSTTGRMRTRVYTSTGRSFTAAAVQEFAVGTVIGRVSADVTGDGRDDLVILRNDGTNDQILWVLKGTATGYTTPARWWYARDEISNTGLRLVASDFTGDGRADAGLLVGRGDFSRSTFYMIRSLGYGFTSKSAWWSGTLDVRRTAAYGGDATGDGRADVLIEYDRGTNGLAYRVLRSRITGGGALYWTGPGLDVSTLRRSSTRTVVSDVDGDGRDDLVLAYPYSTGTRLTSMRWTGSTFSRTHMWTSFTLPVSSLKLGAGDVTGDGAGDVVGFIKRTTGTRLVAFRSNGRAFSTATFLDDTTLNWSAARPY